MPEDFLNSSDMSEADGECMEWGSGRIESKFRLLLVLT
jgi:hypothetical protein